MLFILWKLFVKYLCLYYVIVSNVANQWAGQLYVKILIPICLFNFVDLQKNNQFCLVILTRNIYSIDFTDKALVYIIVFHLE